ncbi:anti-sigma factor [Variovorax sp. OV329]|uniref:anti-sigma factor n=1 Tax=Variovorax sp. OV329 TaxID=1882825 RepID=UPI0008E5265A|nr:anti-sigma factor [Variovorax sp. OV329]SFL90391.1 Transmembrane transcriptional regulator (anti-sigma factor RsiW) [Variovorax sp. OV329]
MKPDEEDEPLSTLIGRHASRHRAPKSLHASIRTQLSLQELREDARRAGPARSWLRRLLDARWRTAGLGFAAGLLCAALVLPLARQAWQGWAEAPQLVALHVRALQAPQLVAVVSSDRHTVRPWFQGRIDYAPPVFDLASDGFVLLGGRADKLRGEAVAALVYKRDLHVIDLYVQPGDGTLRALSSASERGFNLVQWSDGAMRYTAVSDLERRELEYFAALWRERRQAQ